MLRGIGDIAGLIGLYKLGADLGDEKAKDGLEGAYMLGLCELAKGDKEALRMYQLAADQGYVHAQIRLGEFHQARFEEHGVAEDGTKAVGLYRLAADNGDKSALLALGKCYQYGWCGLEPDTLQARIHFQKALH